MVDGEPITPNEKNHYDLVELPEKQAKLFELQEKKQGIWKRAKDKLGGFFKKNPKGESVSSNSSSVQASSEVQPSSDHTSTYGGEVTLAEKKSLEEVRAFIASSNRQPQEEQPQEEQPTEEEEQLEEEEPADQGDQSPTDPQESGEEEQPEVESSEAEPPAEEEPADQGGQSPVEEPPTDPQSSGEEEQLEVESSEAEPPEEESQSPAEEPPEEGEGWEWLDKLDITAESKAICKKHKFAEVDLNNLRTTLRMGYNVLVDDKELVEVAFQLFVKDEPLDVCVDEILSEREALAREAPAREAKKKPTLFARIKKSLPSIFSKKP